MKPETEENVSYNFENPKERNETEQIEHDEPKESDPHACKGRKNQLTILVFFSLLQVFQIPKCEAKPIVKYNANDIQYKNQISGLITGCHACHPHCPPGQHYSIPCGPIIYIMLGMLVVIVLGGTIFFITYRRIRSSNSSNIEASSVKIEETQTELLERTSGADDKSCKVSTWLDCNSTYQGTYGPHETICHKLNALDSDSFKAIICSLGVPKLYVYRFYPKNGTGDFASVLQYMTSCKSDWRLEDLAHTLESKGYHNIAKLARKEDRRLQTQESPE